jgi:adenosine/AMP kinase|uniref:Adenosine monophosphate-protein transferase n=1 Tax=candidate division WOR-3 bacterium TaxID=2052148 RepID=A0A7V3VV81_UNCW3
MEIKKIKITPPEGVNIICGQTHFIKTVEDLYEALVNAVPNIKFGIGFCEASGPCLVRYEGNEKELVELARDYAYKVGAGHFFIIFIKDAYPINVIDKIKNVPEILNIYCATANPVEILYVEDEQGRGIIGVIDGFTSKGIEDEKARKERYEFLRKIRYKL